MACEFDVFLSYHWRDHGPVEAIARALRERGIKPFLDRWYLAAGQPWPQKLEEHLRECRSVAVFLGPDGMGGWQQREKYVALDRQTRDPRFPVIPVLLPRAEPAGDFLALNTWVSFKSGIGDPAALQNLIHAIHSEPPGASILQEVFADVRPFRGLRAFQEEDAPFFFGREDATERTLQAVQQDSVVALVGASGSGKSSVARAGLVPRLRQRAAGLTWEVMTLVPGERPLHALAAELLSFLEPDLDAIERRSRSDVAAANFLKDRGQGRVYLRDLVSDVLEKQPGTDRLMLIVDQWEELYTLTQDVLTRRRFIDELLEASQFGLLSVVLTLRGDFFGHVLADPALEVRLRDATVTLGPMNRAQLREAMQRPLERVHGSFEPGLVERILDDVGDEPGNLPLLEFVLDALWEKRRGGMLLHEAYESDLKRLKGAIATRADQLLESFKKETEQRALRQIFLRLVRPGENAADTLRRATVAEMGEASRHLIDALVKARLVVTSREVVTGQETIEVAHEALINHWERLQTWLNEDREFLLWRKRLNDARDEWLRTGRDTGALLSGARLAEAKRWRRQRSDLNSEELNFIGRSTGLKHSRLAIVAALSVVLILGVVFARWTDQERVSARAGFYLLLAKAGIYYLQPEMVPMPGGSFRMGSLPSDPADRDEERPQHEVKVKPFRISRYEATFDEYDVFAHLIQSDGGCQDEHPVEPITKDEYWERGKRPVINISWPDAVCYVEWLSKKTGQRYRLPTEAEWEYAARAGTETVYWWGNEVDKKRANCAGCGSQWDGKQTALVGSFGPNPWKLYDTAGNVWEWVQDCYDTNYEEARADGTARETGDCTKRVIRGGSWASFPGGLRSAHRIWADPDTRNSDVGLRLAQDLVKPGVR